MDKSKQQQIEERIYHVIQERSEESTQRFEAWFSTNLAIRLAIVRYREETGFTPETAKQARLLCEWAWHAREYEIAMLELLKDIQLDRIVSLENENRRLRWTIENVLEAEQTGPAEKSVQH